MKLVSELISNEKYHYVELNHKEYIQDKTSAMIAISKIDNDLDIICREVTRKAYDIGEVFR